MELIRFVDDLRHQLLVAAEAGGEGAQAQAERLLAPLDPSVRLVLLDALSAAAQEITRELAPGSVDVRLRGLDPEFVVTPPPADQPPAAPADGAATDSGAAARFDPEADEGAPARITLRLPEALKVRVEQAAARSGLSVNSWLVAAAANALGPPPADRQPGPPRGGQHVTGWAR